MKKLIQNKLSTIKDDFKYAFNHMKSNKKIVSFICCINILLLCLALNFSFSMFTNIDGDDLANITVRDMTYALSINGTSGSLVTVGASGKTKVNVSITATNTQDSKYELIYHVCTDTTCNTFIDLPEGLTVQTSSISIDPYTGTISAEGNKNIRLVITNTTGTTYYLKLDINAGYSYNTLELANMYSGEYNETDLTIMAYLDGNELSSLPADRGYFATVACTKNGEASTATGTGEWKNHRWNIDVDGVVTGETVCRADFVATHDHSGANPPVLADNMIPVYYDNASDSWKKADVNNYSTLWYDYDNQIWANAVTVTSGTRSTYNSAAADTAVSMNDIVGFWVWIPRFEYETTNLGTNYLGGTLALPGTLNVKFLDELDPINSTNYLIHPTFRNGNTSYQLPNGQTASNFSHGGWDKELKGFWMGKFEIGTTSNNTSTSALSSGILMKPDLYSKRSISVNNAYNTTKNMQSDHGIGSQVETHMCKNDEWGAVAYLSQSKYGKMGNPNYTGSNKEVYVNNAYYKSGIIFNVNYYQITGRSNGTYAGNGASKQYGTYEYNNCPASGYGKTSCTESVRNSNANLGVGASTTGTIYGVYDMSGGANDFVMGNYNNTASSSGFTFGNAKYYDKYTTLTLTTACNGIPCYGIGWSNETGNGSVSGNYNYYQDKMNMMTSTNAWITRGTYGSEANQVYAGIYTMYNHGGGADTFSSFRATAS